MKKSLTKTFKRYENVTFVAILFSLVAGLFLGIALGAGSVKEVANAFIRQGGLGWFGFYALIAFWCELFNIKSEAHWRFNKVYWIVVFGILYGFLALFATEWHWSAYITPVVLLLRICVPAAWAKEISRYGDTSSD